MTRNLWKFFTSLRLTVACLAIGLVLVFIGTLAQVDEGLYNAQARWFRSFFIWWHLGGLKIPVFPGGYLVGIVLLINLFTSHLKRFVWSPRKIGIHLTHFGVVVLLVGQLATDMLQVETHLSLHEGETKNYSENSRHAELVFATDKENNRQEIVSVPEEIVARRGTLPLPAQLPFAARVTEYHPNGEVYFTGSIIEAGTRLTTALATVEAEFSAPEGLVAQAERGRESEGREGIWRAALAAAGAKASGDIVADTEQVVKDRAQAEKLAKELKDRFRAQMLTAFSRGDESMRYAAERVSQNLPFTVESFPAGATQGAGRDAFGIALPDRTDMDTQNRPYAQVELLQNGTSLGTWLLAAGLRPQDVTIGAKTYHVALRPERTFHPFTLTLQKVTHDVYRGTEIPRNFQSRVHLSNSSTGEERDVEIYMNNPFRYAGLTFYQYQMGPDEAASQKDVSVFQVVRNPGWLAPYLGCILVAAGMVYQFLFHLIGFLAKRKAPQPTAAPPRRKPAPVAV